MTPSEVNALFREHGDYLRNYAFKLQPWRGVDLLHDAAVAALESETAPEKPSQWFAGVLHHTNVHQSAAAYAKKRAGIEVPIPDAQLLDEDAVDASLPCDLERLLASLSPKKRAVMVMHLSGYSRQEIADELGLRNALVVKRIKREAHEEMRAYVNGS